jgi:hypothetical protein
MDTIENVNNFKEESSDNQILIEELIKIQSWNSFAKSLLKQVSAKGTLSDNQIFAANSMLIKMEVKSKALAEKKAKAQAIDLWPLHMMFNEASRNGLTRPKFAIDDLELSLASPNSANPGAIYVKSEKRYSGKIVDGVFRPLEKTSEKVFTKLQSLSKDPIGVATEYGKRMGICSCCSRTLTNKESIERGIGPICADKWGL